MARAVALSLLVVLPLVLPFEAPLFAVGPFTVTSAELAIYAVVAAWLAGGPRGMHRGPLARAVLLWMAVALASALLAPASLKFALRSLGGALLFFAARDLAREPRRIALAVLAGAALSATLALVEAGVPASAPLWQPFRPQAWNALGVPRATGAFSYPTLAAMYWEAALPLCAVLLLGPGLRLVRGGAAAIALAGLLVTAIVLSATRSSIAGAVVGAGALLALGWRAGARVRIAAIATLAASAILVPLVGSTSSLLGQRLRSWSDRNWFAARYQLGDAPPALAAGATLSVPITVENSGTLAWPHAGADAVHLSYHWEVADGGSWRMLVFDGLRTLLPADVEAGATVRLYGRVQAPPQPGRYRLRWDMVREQVTWFSARGSPTADQTVDVAGPPVAAFEPAQRGGLDDLIRNRAPSRPELWRAAITLWRQHPVLGVGPDNFRHMYKEVLPAGEPLLADERLHANSLYFETLADLGLAGCIALALLLVGLLAALRRHVAAGDWVRLACGVGAAAFFVHGLLDTFMAFTPAYGLHWLLLGLTAPPDSKG